mmetsp:Transcript_688/g.2287  ORF Transcript_688/g.2287 Transcript_688/m.2287 type:complete len:852 (-) Transcript_688:133-2688(-)
MGPPGMGPPGMGPPGMGLPGMGPPGTGPPNMGPQNMSQHSMRVPATAPPSIGAQPSRTQSMGVLNMGLSSQGLPGMGPLNMKTPNMGPMAPPGLGPQNMGPPPMGQQGKAPPGFPVNSMMSNYPSSMEQSPVEFLPPGLQNNDNARFGGSKPASMSFATRDNSVDEQERMPRWATLLWPRPQQFSVMSDSREFFLPPELTISAEAEQFRTVSRLAAWLQSCDLDPKVRIIAPQSGRGHIHLSIVKELFGEKRQAYRLVVRPMEICVVGSDAAGLFYGCCTLDQLVRIVCSGGGRASLPCCAMTDWPSLPKRGVMIDISRSKVLSMATLRQLVDRLARLKYNQVQLYIEHTFTYLGHEEVWRDSGALSPEDIMSLDELCRSLFVELVPCQSSLSGFNRWLLNPKYTHLAECPDEATLAGLDTSDARGRMSLCMTDPKSAVFITDLYEQLLPCFTSKQLHVGFDRAADLERGRSGKDVSTKGVEVVAMEYMRRICQVAAVHGKTAVQFWAEIISPMLDDPMFDMSDFSMLIPPGVIAMERGAGADHPFDYRCQRLSTIGLPFYVCPSTSSHTSFGGRASNCLENIRQAAFAAVRYSAAGMLVTDVGTFGHLQPLVASYPGFVAAAGAAWNTKGLLTTGDHGLRHLAALLDAHIFMDSEDTAAIGTILATVGDLHLVAEGKEAGALSQKGSTGGIPPPLGPTRLFQLLIHDGETASLEELPIGGLQRAQNMVERSLELLNSYQGMAGRIDVDEVRLIVELLRLCVTIGKYMTIAKSPEEQHFALNKLPDVQRSDLANGLMRCVDMHKFIWAKRNRQEGFTRSWSWLDKALVELCKGIPELEEVVNARRGMDWKL